MYHTEPPGLERRDRSLLLPVRPSARTVLRPGSSSRCAGERDQYAGYAIRCGALRIRRLRPLCMVCVGASDDVTDISDVGCGGIQ